MDVRRQINTPSERRTELSDRMQRRANHLAAYPAKVSTHRCAPHPQKTTTIPWSAELVAYHAAGLQMVQDRLGSGLYAS